MQRERLMVGAVDGDAGEKKKEELEIHNKWKE